MLINGKDLILGRLSAFVAKKLLLGEKVIIVNSEDVVISGSKQNILERYKQRYSRGDPYKGPFFPRTSDRILRRAIRGMLPFKRTRGKEAFKKIMCYKGIPDAYKNEKLETVEMANALKLKTNFIKLGELERLLKK